MHVLAILGGVGQGGSQLLNDAVADQIIMLYDNFVTRMYIND
jgi:hypothetical protein